MTNILNNKLVVTGLALAAGAIVYFRVVSPMIDMFFPEKLEAAVLEFEDPETFHEDPDQEFLGSTEQELQFANAKYNLTAIDVRNLRWNENPARNPFMPTKNVVREAPKQDTNLITVVKQHISEPVVSAILNSPELKFAVIDGEIFRVGEVYDGYRLSRIESDQVSLTHLITGYSKKLAVTE